MGWVLGIGITLNSVQDIGTWFDKINLLSIEKRSSIAAAGRYFSMMFFTPEVIDFWELIAVVSSSSVSDILTVETVIRRKGRQIYELRRWF